MSNIIFLANHQFYRDANSKINYDLISYIQNNCKKYNITLIWSDVKPSEAERLIIKLKPKLIIVFEVDKFEKNTRKYEFIFGMNIPVYIFIDDTYYLTTSIKNCDLVQKVNGIIFWYRNIRIKNSFVREFPGKFITNIDSRFVNTERFKDWKLQKKYDILLYGSRSYIKNYKSEKVDSIQDYITGNELCYNKKLGSRINFYPLREKLENIITKYKDHFNCLILPQKTMHNCAIANEELSKLINQSYLTIACCSIADVLMHKYFEIAASKSVILGNIPTDYDYLFRGNVIEVNEYMSEDNILSIIVNALANKRDLIEKSERLYKAIVNEHNLNKATDSMTNVISNILSR